jgi:hypothetical protein
MGAEGFNGISLVFFPHQASEAWDQELQIVSNKKSDTKYHCSSVPAGGRPRMQ